MRLKKLLSLIFILFLTSCSSESCSSNSVINVSSCDAAELIQAINDANANPDHTTIHLEAGCIYELTTVATSPGTSGMAQVTGLPPVSTTIIIKGHNATIQRQIGAPHFRIFFVTPSGSLGLHDLSILNGSVINSVYNFTGGGIYVDYGILTLLNSHMENNTAESSGGGIYNIGGIVNIDTSTILSNHAERGGGIFNFYGTVLIHNSSVVNNNTAAISGGGISSYSGEVTIANSQLNNNEADSDGGAVYMIKVSSGIPDLIISGALFDGNTANDKGGAIYMEETDFSIMSSTFTNNQASGTPWSGDNSTSTKGGAIYIEDSMSGTIGFGSLFELNSTDGGGGAIGIDNYINNNWITIQDTTIQNNEAGTRGGGIHNYSSNLSIINSTISSNTALTDEGGGLFHRGELIIDGSTFSDNSSALNGGGVSVKNSILGVAITDSTFQGNQTSEYGGGLSTYNCMITIGEGSFFDNNTAQKGGGGIYTGQGTVLYLEDSTVSNNNALTESGGGFGGGGGIYNSSQTGLTISSTAIFGNTSQLDGGGLLNTGHIVIYESAIYDNTAAHNGGGILTTGGYYMKNSTVSGNQAGDTGGGVYAVVSLPNYSEIRYSTIVHNTSIASPGGLLANNNASSIFLNTIVALNTPFDCSNINAASTIFDENLDSDGTCTGFTITANPLIGPLADNGGPTWTHALLSGSPAIDAVTTYIEAHDQRYAVRPGGSACDIGAYEVSEDFVPPPPIPLITPTPSTYSCDGILGVSLIEDDLIRIQVSTPGLPAGIYDAMAGESDFICKTYPEYPDKLFCDGPRGEPGSFATLIIYDPLGLPFCELPFGFPSRDVPEEPKGCSKYTNDITCNADPKCFWNKTTDTCQTK